MSEAEDPEVFSGWERLAAELAVKLNVPSDPGGLIVVMGASGRASHRCCVRACCRYWDRGQQAPAATAAAALTVSVRAPLFIFLADLSAARLNSAA